MLDVVFQRIWSDLAIPVGAERNPFRLMQLATIGPQGWPKCRTVVLRSVDQNAGTLCFYADQRSALCAQLLADERVALTALSPCGVMQVRIEGAANLVDDLAQRQHCWQQARDRTQALFRHGGIPGQIIDTPEQACEHLQEGFKHFAIIRVQMKSLEWLDLSRTIHQRARFVRQQAHWQSSWCAP